MPYCQTTDFNLIIPQAKLEALLGLDNSLEPNPQFDLTMTQYITLASSEIDMTIGNLYQTPVPSTAIQTLGMLKSLCILLAIGYVYGMNADGSLPDGIKMQIALARERLSAYGAGGVYQGRIFVPVRFPDAPSNMVYGIVSPDPIYPTPDEINQAHSLYR